MHNQVPAELTFNDRFGNKFIKSLESNIEIFGNNWKAVNWANSSSVQVNSVVNLLRGSKMWGWNKKYRKTCAKCQLARAMPKNECVAVFSCRFLCNMFAMLMVLQIVCLCFRGAMFAYYGGFRFGILFKSTPKQNFFSGLIYKVNLVKKPKCLTWAPTKNMPSNSRDFRRLPSLPLCF